VSLTWKPEPELLSAIDEAVPSTLASQKENGQFGTEPWVCGDQNVVFSLAAAWHLEGSAYHHDDKVLAAIVKGGDALIEAQDADGKWEFLKKDYSTWGQILMPWTYSRWIRAYELVRESMAPGDRERWDRALLLGFEGISATCLHGVHNIPAHHAMALFSAGRVFGRDEWKAQSAAFMQKVVDAQSPNGWWAEGGGPVVSYNFVYSDALGTYYGMSGDGAVLNALELAARYHASLTYPDGSAVETVDGRNPYHAGVHLGNPGFTHTAPGRGYLAQQHAFHLETGKGFGADYAANLLLYGAEGEAEETAAGRDRHVWRMGDEAVTVRRRPWFVCMSAFLTDLPDNRWIQDRQNFVSVYHDKAGLIVGGGNTKLQPLWGNFTVGDRGLLKHTPGDESPDFTAREGLLHVPDDAAYEADEDAAQLTLKYGSETCKVTATPETDTTLRLVYEATSVSSKPVYGHVTLLPTVGEALRFASGEEMVLGEGCIGREGEAWVSHKGWKVHLPEGSRVVWPVLPHNPYRKQGQSTVEEGRIVIEMAFSAEAQRQEIRIEIEQ
jgi:hypothetical protein